MSDKQDNPEEILKDVLTLSCQYLKEKLRSGQATAADIQAARALLRDNGITALKVPGSPTGELEETLDNAEFPFAIPGKILPEDDPAVKRATGE